jgi:hypothetical protein
MAESESSGKDAKVGHGWKLAMRATIAAFALELLAYVQFEVRGVGYANVFLVLMGITAVSALSLFVGSRLSRPDDDKPDTPTLK